MAILPENEFTEFEGKYYINPDVSLGEQNSFIDNLRSTQQANNQQIKTDTYNLGTAVPSNLGGLVGGEGYFTARYQTPQTNSLANDLRAVAQANALNQVLSNEQEKWKTRYTRAANAAKVRSSNGGGGSNGSTGLTEGGVDDEDTLEKFLSSYEWAKGDEPVRYDLNTGVSAGWGDWNDLFTGKYNFTLPGGLQLELGGNDEELKYGSDGNYYVWHKPSNTYYKVTGKYGDNSSVGGETKWWMNN